VNMAHKSRCVGEHFRFILGRSKLGSFLGPYSPKYKKEDKNFPVIIIKLKGDS